MKPGIYLHRPHSQDRTVVLVVTDGNGVFRIDVNDNMYAYVTVHGSYAETKVLLTLVNGPEAHLMYIPLGNHLVVDDVSPIVLMGEEIIDFINED